MLVDNTDNRDEVSMFFSILRMSSFDKCMP